MQLNMKNIRSIAIIIVVLSLLTLIATVRADDAQPSKPKPYPLDRCLVCGMKLGEMGQPFVFVYKGQEIKVCDKSEKADFDKAPEKFMKKLADAEAKLKK